ncbi:MAG: SpoIIE family protein phosphatase [Crocinitomicaceae bacterium]|nr:SpoIIE family protein phosphatase [Crocinitomicaceae bacterium]MBK8927893.1 SpoIIE family protein phosphatase [Crocinitomicaceae bacterium]
MFARVYIVIVLALSTFMLNHEAYAQSSKVDSLEKQLMVTTGSEAQADLLQQIYDEVEVFNYERANKIAHKYYLLATETLPNSKHELEAILRMGNSFMYLEKNDSALYYYKELINKSSELKDTVFLSKAYNNLGVLNANTGDLSAGIYYFKKSSELDALIGDNEGSITGYSNIGAIFAAQDKIDSALLYLNRALDAALVLQNPEIIIACYIDLSVIHNGLGKLDETQRYAGLALEVAKQQNDLSSIAQSERMFAITYQKEKKFKIAVEHDLLSLNAANDGGALEHALLAIGGLAFSYEQMGMYKEAIAYHKMYRTYSDSLKEINNEAEFIRASQEYNAEQAIKENEILYQKSKIKDLEIEKSEEELANSRIVIISSIVGLFLLVVLALTLYNRNIIKQRANQKLHDANAIIQAKNNDIIASIDYASKIQEALLPNSDEPNLFQDSFFLLKPKDIVSGDFVWHTQVDDYKVFAAVDCTGHGVPGAFMSMIGNAFLQQIIVEMGLREPGKILDQLREKIITALNQKKGMSHRRDGMDMALCVLDTKNNKLHFAGANNPLFMIQQNVLVEIQGDKQPVGFFEGLERPFTSHSIDVLEGDCVYVFSDGYVDQFGGPKGKKFKYKQLKELLMNIHHKKMQEQKNILNQTFIDWKGDLEQLDDVCIVGVRI